MTDKGEVHVCAWEVVTGMQYEMKVPVFAAGGGQDEPPPEGVFAHRKSLSPLDFNPGSALQQVTVAWGHLTTKETEDAQE